MRISIILYSFHSIQIRITIGKSCCFVPCPRMTLAVNRRSSESVRRALRFFPEPSLIYTASRGKAQYSWVTSTRSKGIAPFHQLRSVAFAKLPVGRHTPSGDIGSGLAVRFCSAPAAEGTFFNERCSALRDYRNRKRRLRSPLDFSTFLGTPLS